MAKATSLNKKGRLLSAGNWIKSYNGKNIVQGYARHYGVDLLCAIRELRILNIEVKEEYEIAVKRCIAERTLQKKKKEAKEKQEVLLNDYSDASFAFIAGYTSGGAPYGVTWEQMENENT